MKCLIQAIVVAVTENPGIPLLKKAITNSCIICIWKTHSAHDSQDMVNPLYIYIYIYIYVTGFAKRGLPHTCNFQASTICNFRCVKAMDLEIVQLRALT